MTTKDGQMQHMKVLLRNYIIKSTSVSLFAVLNRSASIHKCIRIVMASICLVLLTIVLVGQNLIVTDGQSKCFSNEVILCSMIVQCVIMEL